MTKKKIEEGLIFLCALLLLPLSTYPENVYATNNAYTPSPDFTVLPPQTRNVMQYTPSPDSTATPFPERQEDSKPPNDNCEEHKVTNWNLKRNISISNKETIETLNEILAVIDPEKFKELIKDLDKKYGTSTQERITIQLVYIKNFLETR